MLEPFATMVRVLPSALHCRPLYLHPFIPPPSSCPLSPALHLPLDQPQIMLGTTHFMHAWYHPPPRIDPISAASSTSSLPPHLGLVFVCARATTPARSRSLFTSNSNLRLIWPSPRRTSSVSTRWPASSLWSTPCWARRKAFYRSSGSTICGTRYGNVDIIFDYF